MSRRSPFGFQTLHISVWHVLPTILVAFAGLVGLELAFRHWSPFNLYEGWGSAALQEKLHGVDKSFKRRGRIDLITLSTSVGRPMDVRQWEEGCAGKIVCYNFAFPENRPERQRFLFEEYFWPKYHIKNVIYGLAPPDVNSGNRGMDPEHPKSGEFWQYSAVKRLLSRTLFQKIRAHVEDLSVLFTARRHVRSTLQNGMVFDIPSEKTLGEGVYIPSPRRLALGPMEVPWTFLPGMSIHNAYLNYWIPETGEMGEVLKLAKFCKARGVNFAVVEIPTSDYSHTQFWHKDYYRPEEDYTTFTAMLDWLRYKGVEVLPMARDLNLDNTYYEDLEHLNRWGGQAMTNYVYEKVICRWFANNVLAPTLPEPQQIELWKNIPADSSSVRTEQHFGINKDAQYTSLKQVIVSTAGTKIPVGPVDPGSYSFELYAGDGTTTSPEQTGEARIQLSIQEEGEAPRYVLLNTWANARLSISYTQYHLTVKKRAELALEVDKLGPRPCILDSVFLRRKLFNTGDGFTIE